MRLRIIALTTLLLLPQAILAQRRGHTVRKPKVEEPVEDPRITQMLASTRQITFIDSMVVNKDAFMNHIPLSEHCGRISQTDGRGTFTNEMGDYQLTTTADTVIASRDFIANRWTAPQPIDGIGSTAAMNPFLMPDGVTLYFAQKGERSIGGYDIFVTRYDSEKGVFLKPENVGMPFASTANDLFFAIDEFNQLGYFVTDRRQKEGEVCIYIFIPTEARLTYSTETCTDTQLRSLAAINSIADTWVSDDIRNEALGRLETARKAGRSVSTTKTDKQQSELDKLRHEANVLAKTLSLTRNYYATASENEQQKLRDEIMNSEQQLELLQMEIKKKEKLIPNNN